MPLGRGAGIPSEAEEGGRPLRRCDRDNGCGGGGDDGDGDDDDDDEGDAGDDEDDYDDGDDGGSGVGDDEDEDGDDDGPGARSGLPAGRRSAEGLSDAAAAGSPRAR